MAGLRQTFKVSGVSMGRRRRGVLEVFLLRNNFDFKGEIIIAKQAGFPLGGVSGRFNHQAKMPAQSWRNLFSGTP